MIAGEELKAVLDKAYEQGLRVILPYQLPPQVELMDYADNTARSLLLASLRPWVRRFRDHHTHLMYAPGHEVLTAIALIAWARRRRARLAEQIGYAVLLGGALGNLVDRLARGYVVDFLHLHHWPVFNVADVAVVAGAVFLAIVSGRAAPAQRPGEMGG